MKVTVRVTVAPDARSKAGHDTTPALSVPRFDAPTKVSSAGTVSVTVTPVTSTSPTFWIVSSLPGTIKVTACPFWQKAWQTFITWMLLAVEEGILEVAI